MIDQDNDLRPWVPPGAREFRVGDKVRVRLSGECQRIAYLHSESRVVKEIMGHDPKEEGLEGTLVVSRYPATQSDHLYLVEFDRPAAVWSNLVLRIRYAPSELELLEAADAT